jgi:hypothetical protein
MLVFYSKIGKAPSKSYPHVGNHKFMKFTHNSANYIHNFIEKCITEVDIYINQNVIYKFQPLIYKSTKFISIEDNNKKANDS